MAASTCPRPASTRRDSRPRPTGGLIPGSAPPGSAFAPPGASWLDVEAETVRGQVRTQTAHVLSLLPEGPGPQPKGVPGLYHVAFAVGATLDELAAARRWVESHGLTPFGEYERGFCVRDPDGHEVELYVEPAASRSTK